jgi:hypothetical protein
MDIVESVEGLTGEPLVFYQVVYQPTEGFPAANELITNTTSAEECCIECKTTVSTPLILRRIDVTDTPSSPSAQDPSSLLQTSNAIYALLNPLRPRSQVHLTVISLTHSSTLLTPRTRHIQTVILPYHRRPPVASLLCPQVHHLQVRLALDLRLLVLAQRVVGSCISGRSWDRRISRLSMRLQ